MPDLQSELYKALDKLDLSDGATSQPDVPASGPRSNMHRLFDAVRDNPSSTSLELREIMSDFDAVSISSMLNQLTKRGLLSRVKHAGVYAYTTTIAQFPAYDRLEIIRKAAAASAVARKKRGRPPKNRAKPTNKVPVYELPDVPALRLPTPPLHSVVAQELVDSLPIAKARAVYDILHTYFGGAR